MSKHSSKYLDHLIVKVLALCALCMLHQLETATLVLFCLSWMRNVAKSHMGREEG